MFLIGFGAPGVGGGPSSIAFIGLLLVVLAGIAVAVNYLTAPRSADTGKRRSASDKHLGAAT